MIQSDRLLMPNCWPFKLTNVLYLVMRRSRIGRRSGGADGQRASSIVGTSRSTALYITVRDGAAGGDDRRHLRHGTIRSRPISGISPAEEGVRGLHPRLASAAYRARWSRTCSRDHCRSYAGQAFKGATPADDQRLLMLVLLVVEMTGRRIGLRMMTVAAIRSVRRLASPARVDAVVEQQPTSGRLAITHRRCSAAFDAVLEFHRRFRRLSFDRGFLQLGCYVGALSQRAGVQVVLAW